MASLIRNQLFDKLHESPATQIDDAKCQFCFADYLESSFHARMVYPCPKSHTACWICAVRHATSGGAKALRCPRCNAQCLDAVVVDNERNTDLLGIGPAARFLTHTLKAPPRSHWAYEEWLFLRRLWRSQANAKVGSLYDLSLFNSFHFLSKPAVEWNSARIDDAYLRFLNSYLGRLRNDTKPRAAFMRRLIYIELGNSATMLEEYLRFYGGHSIGAQDAVFFHNVNELCPWPTSPASNLISPSKRDIPYLIFQRHEDQIRNAISTMGCKEYSLDVFGQTLFKSMRDAVHNFHVDGEFGLEEPWSEEEDIEAMDQLVLAIRSVAAWLSRRYSSHLVYVTANSLEK
jgi:hypothetical protein